MKVLERYSTERGRRDVGWCLLDHDIDVQAPADSETAAKFIAHG
jgi:hypothetical protein